MNTPTKKEKDQGWGLLFDVQKLDKWEMFNGRKTTGWSVENEEMKSSGAGWDGGQDIITIEGYEILIYIWNGKSHRKTARAGGR